MAETDAPIRTDLAVLHKARRNMRGTLILYPDRLTYVRSLIPFWYALLGGAVVALLAVVITGSAPGTAGAAVGASGGLAVGGAIARRRAPAKAAAGGAAVTVIPLDSIAGVTSRKGGRIRGGQVVVSTQDGPEYTFRINPAQWPADLEAAVAVRGHSVQGSPAGFAVLTPRG